MNNDTSLELRIEKARNSLRFVITKLTADYKLPGILIEMVIESVLSDLKQGRLSFMAEQITIESAEEPASEDEK